MAANSRSLIQPRTRTVAPQPVAPAGPLPTATAPSWNSPGESLRNRAVRLLHEEIDFIPNRSFIQPGAEEQLAAENQRLDAENHCDRNVPRDLPGHLARLVEANLLSAEEEPLLFQRMNFLKFKANAIRSDLNPEWPNADAMQRVERYLDEARAIRDRIVQSNMRLAISVVKKFVTPRHSFDEMLSDGIYSLMQAVEKFDYDRGFRFSTYAYQAIARNAYRRIKQRQCDDARFACKADESYDEIADQGGTSSVQERAWDRLRALLSELMDSLDRRERFIIRSRYALGAHRRVRTFQFLADKLGVSKERVRQLEQRAVAKLRTIAAEQQLDEVAHATLD